LIKNNNVISYLINIILIKKVKACARSHTKAWKASYYVGGTSDVFWWWKIYFFHLIRLFAVSFFFLLGGMNNNVFFFLLGGMNLLGLCTDLLFFSNFKEKKLVQNPWFFPFALLEVKLIYINIHARSGSGLARIVGIMGWPIRSTGFC